MTRRRWIAVGMIAALGLGIAFILLAAMPQSVITKDKYRALKAGMTRDEVRALVGGAPDRHDLGVETWIGFEGCATLTYDQKGGLVWREWNNLPYRKRFPESLFGKIQKPFD